MKNILGSPREFSVINSWEEKCATARKLAQTSPVVEWACVYTSFFWFYREVCGGFFISRTHLYALIFTRFIGRVCFRYRYCTCLDRHIVWANKGPRAKFPFPGIVFVYLVVEKRRPRRLRSGRSSSQFPTLGIVFRRDRSLVFVKFFRISGRICRAAFSGSSLNCAAP